MVASGDHCGRDRRQGEWSSGMDSREVFGRGKNNALWHTQRAEASSDWSDWASLGGWIDNPVVAYNADGRLEVFAVGPDQALWHIRQTMPGSDWGVWASLGGWVANPVSKFNLDGRLEVFARGSDNALWHIE